MTHKFVPKNRNLKIGKYFAHKCGVWSSQINDSKMPKWAPSSIHRSPQLLLLLPVQHCAKFSVVKHAQGFCGVGVVYGVVYDKVPDNRLELSN